MILGQITFMDTLLFWGYTVVVLPSAVIVLFLIAAVVGKIFRWINKREEEDIKTNDTLTYEEYNDRMI